MPANTHKPISAADTLQSRLVWTAGGANSGPAELQFGRVREVSPFGTDREGIAVLDLFPQTVSVIDRASGKLRFAVGGRGYGPGEFRGATSIGIRGDTLIVLDVTTWRRTTFVDSMFLASEPIKPLEISGWEIEAALTSEGDWLFLDQSIASSEAPPANSIVRASARLLRNVGSDWNKVVVLPGQEAAFVAGPRDQMGLADAPFPARPLWAPSSDGSIWYADSRSYKLVRFAKDGTAEDSIVVSANGRAVTGEEMAAYVQPRDNEPAEIAAGRRALRIPEEHPVLSALVADEDGGVWIAFDEEVNGSRQWNHHERPFVSYAVLWLPANVRLHRASKDQLIGVSTDSVGVQRVVIYQVFGQ